MSAKKFNLDEEIKAIQEKLKAKRAKDLESFRVEYKELCEKHAYTHTFFVQITSNGTEGGIIETELATK
jgi:hypothetical protein